MSGKQFNFAGRYNLRKLAKTLLILLICSSSFAKRERVVYLNKIYGQIHQNASKFSRVLSTFECGQPFKVVGDEQLGYIKVKYASYIGYIQEEHISQARPKNCWQDQYSKFFDYLGLGVSEMHYWGRLQDMLIQGRSMP